MRNKIIILIVSIIIILGHAFIIKDGINEYTKSKKIYEESKITEIEYVIETLENDKWVETDRYSVYITE